MAFGSFTGMESQVEQEASMLAKDAFILEAIHLRLIQQFGDSYRGSESAEMMRREIYEKSGREAA